jgi:DNA-directed RNA polymerase subunit E'/Rpb7
MKFDPDANPPRFAAGERGEEDAVIEKGTRVRVKIVGTRVDATEIFAIGPSRSLNPLVFRRSARTGTIKEDYLGMALLCLLRLRLT